MNPVLRFLGRTATILIAATVLTASPLTANAAEGPSAVVTPPYIILTHLVSGAAPGVTMAGPFATGPIVAGVDHYVTVRWSLSPTLTGQLIDVYVATRASNGRLGAWTLLTKRLTDAHGRAYFTWRSAKPESIAVLGRFGGGTHFTPSSALPRSIVWQ